jgi:hypothetical protein
VKAHLEIVRGEDIPLQGHCSSCPNVLFFPKKEQTGRIEQEAYIRALFDDHFVHSHLRDGMLEASIQKM